MLLVANTCNPEIGERDLVIILATACDHSCIDTSAVLREYDLLRQGSVENARGYIRERGQDLSLIVSLFRVGNTTQTHLLNLYSRNLSRSCHLRATLLSFITETKLQNC